MKSSLNGYRLDLELKNVPVSFVNALRRICLSEIPTVVVTNVQIVDNATSMTHEMLRHRVEMLPVNVLPEDAAVLRDTKLELRFLPAPDAREITTDDFVVTGPREGVLLRDRDLDEPLLLLTLNPKESVHIKATLGIESRGLSQVCVATFKNHIDEILAANKRDEWILAKKDPRVFDTYEIQRCYAKDEEFRPYWFDFTVESIGTMKAVDILTRAVEILKGKIQEFGKVPIQREGEVNWYRMEMDGETYTLGALVQTLMYQAKLVDWVTFDIGHPLQPKLILRFQTKVLPDMVVERFRGEALALCENVLQSV